MQFATLQNKLNALPYPKQLIGKSAMGQDINAFFIGDPQSKNKVLIDGAMHAREWITALLLVELMDSYAKKNVCGCLIFVPLCNPDGVRLALDGAGSDFFQRRKNKLLKINNGSSDFSLWKANANGVDLNVNFDADWGKGKSNIRVPASANYIGKSPNSEPENKALISFTKKLKPSMVLSYHSKGEVIYYGFEKSPLWQQNRDKNFARYFAQYTGYTAEKTVGSTGGFSDWISLRLGLPAFTLEVGSDDLKHPITEKQLEEIVRQNIEVPRLALLLGLQKPIKK